MVGPLGEMMMMMYACDDYACYARLVWMMMCQRPAMKGAMSVTMRVRLTESRLRHEGVRIMRMR